MGVGGVLLLGLAVGQGPLAETTYRAQAQVAGELVRLDEVMDVTGLPPAVRDRAAGLPVARAPKPGGRLIIETARLNSRVRATMPAIAPWLPAAGGKVSVTRRPASVEQVKTHPCQEVVTPLKAGDYPTVADLAPASCASRPRPAFVRDAASGLVRASRDMAPGDRIPETPAAALATIRPGDRLRLSTRVGAVRLEREVEAVRPAGADQAVFVKGLTGAAFSAPQSEFEP